MKSKALFVSLIAAGLILVMNGCQSGTGQAPKAEATGEKLVSVINYNEDMGGQPWVVNIEEATLGNTDYRNVIWTGNNIQLVLMTLKPGEIIDLEIHETHDQFIRVEEGDARILMGKTRDELDFDKKVTDDWVVLVPAGYWHKVENIGNTELKVYTIYGPPEHPVATIHKTYEEAAAAEHDH